VPIDRRSSHSIWGTSIAPEATMGSRCLLLFRQAGSSTLLFPSWGWVATTIASMAKIAAPMLLAGKSVRTPSLCSFRALVMSPRGEIHGFPTEPLIRFLSPFCRAQGSLPPLVGHLKQLEAGTRTSLIRKVGTLLGVPSTAAWAYLLSIPRTSVFPQGGLEAQESQP